MVTLRALGPDDATALTRIYSGASIQHTTGKPLTLDQAHEKIRCRGSFFLIGGRRAELG
ncbi:hypothetical protein [Streptomyces sp. NPDC048611]|uniref:hypothetical protein n=1 Tax=Streptomyces sp. NPDC048611 TaxID=3155635 RepID=UPI00341A0D90